MKKIYIAILICFLCSCVEVGNFPANRQKLHDAHSSGAADFCKKNPQRCIDSATW